MSDESVIAPVAPARWKPWAAAGFAALWGALGALLMQPPARGFMEETAAYSGKLFGFGMAPGLLAAAVAHLLVLRGGSGRAKGLTYLAGALVGGFASVALHG